MNYYERVYFPYYFFTTLEFLYTLSTNKIIRRVFAKLIEKASFHDYALIPNVTVTKLTKELHYKNKSTVSRALKTLRKMEVIIPTGNKNEYQLNYFVMPEPIG